MQPTINVMHTVLIEVNNDIYNVTVTALIIFVTRSYGVGL